MAQFWREYLRTSEDHFSTHYNKTVLRSRVRFSVKLKADRLIDLADQTRRLVIGGAEYGPLTSPFSSCARGLGSLRF